MEQMTLRRAVGLFAALLVAAFVASSVIAPVASAKPKGSGSDGVLALLESSGFRYTKTSPSSWSVVFEGNHKPEVSVLILSVDNQLLIEGIVALRDELAGSADAMRQLLKLNDAFSNVTFLIDVDDDVVARAPLLARKVSAKDFRSTVGVVAVATDSAWAKIAPFISEVAGERGAGMPAELEGPTGATDHVLLLGGKASLHFDPRLWKQGPTEAAGKLTFAHRNGDGYAMVIAERVEIPVDQLKRIALSNARDASTDARIVEEERRTVNGANVLMLRLEGTMHGIKFTFLGYYYGGPAGTVQVITYTGQNLFGEYRSDFEDFLNGFEVAP